MLLKKLILTSLLLTVPSVSLAVPLHKVLIAGKDKINYSVENMNNIVITKDSAKQDQTTPVNCSQLFFSLLARGDIEGASKLSNDPEKIKSKYTKYRERLGEKDFLELMSGYFSASNKIKYLFSIGKNYILVVHDSSLDADIAQTYVKVGNIFLEDEKENPEREKLLKVYNALKDDNGIVTVN